jgi:hypothetical protein
VDSTAASTEATSRIASTAPPVAVGLALVVMVDGVTNIVLVVAALDEVWIVEVRVTVPLLLAVALSVPLPVWVGLIVEVTLRWVVEVTVTRLTVALILTIVVVVVLSEVCS